MVGESLPAAIAEGAVLDCTGGPWRLNLLDLFDPGNGTCLRQRAQGPPVFARNLPLPERTPPTGQIGNVSTYLMYRPIYSTVDRPNESGL